MKSELNISEFRDILKNKTKNGHPKLKFFTPFSWFFNDSAKPFYGLYDDFAFSLTSNLKTNQSMFIVRGNYKLVNGKLKIEYKIVPRYKYQYHFWTFCIAWFIILLSFINVQLLKNNQEINLWPINFLSISMLCFGIFRTINGKRNLKKNFNKSFQICT